jgi:ribonuclease P protein component
MLSQERHVSQSLFAQILKEGKSFHTQHLSLRVCVRKDQGKSAFSFVVSSKAVKKATERNLLKRRARHVIKKHLPDIKEGYFCAFFFKKELVTFSFTSFEQELLDGLKQAKMLR